MNMNISPKLKQTATKDFDNEFGEIVRQFADNDRDYEYFQHQFLYGVQFGLSNNRTKTSDLIEESHCRYGHLGGEVESLLYECSSYVFLYGAEWGSKLTSNIHLKAS